MTSREWTYRTIPLSFYRSVSAITLRGEGLLILAAFLGCLIQWSFAPRKFGFELALLCGCLFYFLLRTAYISAASRSTWMLTCENEMWTVLWQSMFGTVRIVIPLTAIVRADVNENSLSLTLKDENGERVEELLHGCVATDAAEAALLMNQAGHPQEIDR